MTGAPSGGSGDESDPAYLLGTNRRLLAEVQALSSRIAAVNEIATAMNRTLDLEEILRIVGRQAKWLLDFEHFSVCLLRDGVCRRVVTLFGPAEGSSGIELGGDDAISRAVRTGQPQLVRDAPVGGFLASFASQAILPLGSEHGVIGTANFAAHAAHAYSIEDIRIGYLLALQLAAALRNAERFEELAHLNARLKEEKARSDRLMLNILPGPIAAELMRTGRVAPVHFASASVLFTDFTDFTRRTEELAPSELVSELDECFSFFDEVMRRHGLEKLKTIGDSYMCVGGIPVPDPKHAVNSVRAALEIRDFVRARSASKPSGAGWDIRIGIHTGPLLAGIIGRAKFSYDVWGDTVNMASRMETSALPGTVNISAETHALVQQHFDCEHRGKIEVKGKGPVDMFVVHGASVHLSE
ncbi:MAG: adenylate cyclase [Nannocystis sp.]|nr:adenylate/guanylate cyclase domain-containing protein [Nannocystis sp.]MBA3550119.1 adenylate cyclase [Nannocystis sp.]